MDFRKVSYHGNGCLEEKCFIKNINRQEMDSPGPLTLPTQTKKFLPKRFLLLTQNYRFFERNIFSHPPERTDSLLKEKIPYTNLKI